MPKSKEVGARCTRPYLFYFRHSQGIQQLVNLTNPANLTTVKFALHQLRQEIGRAEEELVACYLELSGFNGLEQGELREELRKTSASHYFEVGERHRLGDNALLATVSYTRSLEQWPSLDALLGRAAAYIALNNLDKALADYARLSEVMDKSLTYSRL